MPKEMDGYRDELEQILKFFDGKRVLKATEVARYTGKSDDWCRAKFGITAGHPISATQLARAMTKM